MSIKCQIVVNNSSGKHHQYILYVEPASTSGHVDIWMKSPGIDSPNGSTTFNIDSDIFAVCGTSSTTPGQGAGVSTLDWTPVTLATDSTPGTALTLSIVEDGPSLAPLADGCKTKGCYSIQVAKFEVGKYPNVFCGLGKRDQNAKVVPLSIFPAQPESTYMIAGVTKFYISSYKHTEGITIVSDMIGKPAVIDFSQAKAGQTVATITENNDGIYSNVIFTAPS